MNVKNINGSSLGKISTPTTQETKKEEKSQDSKPTQAISVNDKLQISDEGKRMQEIRRRINNGFYNSALILQETSKKIFEKIIK